MLIKKSSSRFFFIKTKFLSLFDRFMLTITEIQMNETRNLGTIFVIDQAKATLSYVASFTPMLVKKCEIALVVRQKKEGKKTPYWLIQEVHDNHYLRYNDISIYPISGSLCPKNKSNPLHKRIGHNEQAHHSYEESTKTETSSQGMLTSELVDQFVKQF